jgi:hypothetical protein
MVKVYASLHNCEQSQWHSDNSANSDTWLRHAGRNRCRKMPAMEGRQIVNCPFFDAETISEHQKGSS